MYSVSPSVISTSRAAAGGAGGAGAGAAGAAGAMIGGAAGVGGSTTPVGAVGAGIGSRTAIGVSVSGASFGVGRTALGEGCVGGGGGGGATLGGSISMMRVKISTGTTISAARRSKPFCRDQSTATCNTTTLVAIMMLRFRVGRTGVVVSTGGDSPKRA